MDVTGDNSYSNIIAYDPPIYGAITEVMNPKGINRADNVYVNAVSKHILHLFDPRTRLLSLYTDPFCYPCILTILRHVPALG